MIAKALRRAKTRYGLFIIAALLFTAGVFGAIGLTSAIFQARFDSKTATFAGGYVAVPTIAGVLPKTGTGSGYDGVLTWTNGTDETTTANEVQQIFGADRGTTTNCTGASYSTTVLASTTSPTTTTTFTYTDSNRATSPSLINGDWYCYEVLHGWPTTTAPVWTATATTNVQIGLAPTSVAYHNGGTAAKVDTNDTITITYNQPVTGAGACGTNNCSDVCQFHTTGTGGDTILIGDTTCSAVTDAYTVGKITGVTNGGGNNSHVKAGAKIVISGNTITVTVQQNGQTETGAGSFLSSTSVKSSVVTDQATACTSVASTCTLTGGTITGTF